MKQLESLSHTLVHSCNEIFLRIVFKNLSILANFLPDKFLKMFAQPLKVTPYMVYCVM